MATEKVILEHILFSHHQENKFYMKSPVKICVIFRKGLHLIIVVSENIIGNVNVHLDVKKTSSNIT